MMVVADCHDDPFALSVRRDRFTSVAFTHAIASHQRSGMVLLLPEERTLAVSLAPEDYERVRVFSDNGKLIGMMVCSPEGLVCWVTPTSP